MKAFGTIDFSGFFCDDGAKKYVDDVESGRRASVEGSNHDLKIDLIGFLIDLNIELLPDSSSERLSITSRLSADEEEDDTDDGGEIDGDNWSPSASASSRLSVSAGTPFTDKADEDGDGSDDDGNDEDMEDKGTNVEFTWELFVGGRIVPNSTVISTEWCRRRRIFAGRTVLYTPVVCIFDFPQLWVESREYHVKEIEEHRGESVNANETYSNIASNLNADDAPDERK